MKKYDSDGHVKGQAAVASANGYGKLAARIGAWRSQISRHSLLEQARQLALNDAAGLTKEHNTLQTAVNSAAQATNGAGATGQSTGSAADHAAKLADLRERSAERQLLSIYDDRIQTEQQLAAVYGKWADQVLLQHRIVF